MNKEQYQAFLATSTQRLRVGLGLEANDTVDTAVVLGTGWADAFPFKAECKIPMRKLGGVFKAVEKLEGHDRIYEIGMVGDKRIIVLRGRVHMNEFVFDPAGKLAVRAQVEVLIGLGGKKIVLTTGVGGLTDEVPVNGVVLIDGWASDFSEEMPFFPGEFKNPEDTIMTDHFDAIIAAGPEGLPIVTGGHVFWHGPHFEGRRYDKSHMAARGASCVSMSVKPEACIAALYPGVRTLPMGFVCNGPTEPMDHDNHRAAAKAAAPLLGQLLTNVVRMLDS